MAEDEVDVSDLSDIEVSVDSQFTPYIIILTLLPAGISLLVTTSLIVLLLFSGSTS